MGNLKTSVLTCFGGGLAAGAGFYLYMKFTTATEDAKTLKTLLLR